MDLSRTDGRSISLPIHHNCGLHWSCFQPGRFDRSSLTILAGLPVAALDPMPVSYQCNPGCVPAFHRVGGWGVRPATRFVRTSLSFQLPAGH